MPEGSSPEMYQTPSIGEQFFYEIKAKQGLDNMRMREQVHILKELPKNFIEQAYGHLLSEKTIRDKYSEGIPSDKLNESSDFTMLTGFINECLATIQVKNTFPEFKTDKRKEHIEAIENYENKILQVTNNPDRFGLEWHKGRNPDVACLRIDDEDNVVIDGVVEITTSRQLNKRKFQQLADSGFEATLHSVARKLNDLEDGDSRGLPEFGKNKKKVVVSKKLIKYLIVHHDMDISPEGLENSIGKTVSNEELAHLDTRERNKVFSENEKQKFLSILNSENTVIIKSSFTNEEIHTLADYVIKQIKTKYPSYKP
jgi:hypothetical protein